MKKMIGALLLAPMFAHASGFVTGNDLLRNMNSESIGNRMHALGFVIGVHDTLSDEVICAPNGVTAGQLRDVVKKKLTENPEVRDMGAAVLVMVTLAGTYPCPDKKGKGGKLL
jgi:hypothetical protein